MIRPERTARVWKRLLAFLVDVYFGIVMFSSFFIIIEKSLPHTLDAMSTYSLPPISLAALIYASIFFLLYHVFCEYIIGQTPGMIIFGISAKPAKNSSSKTITFWQAVGRNIFIVPIFPFTILWLVEPVYYLIQGERLMDRWTSTTLVEN